MVKARAPRLASGVGAFALTLLAHARKNTKIFHKNERVGHELCFCSGMATRAQAF
jgi:hypothetical protein